MRDFLLLQLIFNVLILVSLMVLARGAAPARRRRRPAAGPAERRRPAEPPAPQSPVSSPAGHLSELIEQTEREELVAEAALRERLSRFRTRMAG